MEEIRTNCFSAVVERLNVPSSVLTVPVTKVESGRDSRTTLAYGNGWFCSSTSFPLMVCAEMLIGMSFYCLTVGAKRKDTAQTFHLLTLVGSGKTLGPQ